MIKALLGVEAFRKGATVFYEDESLLIMAVKEVKINFCLKPL